MVLAQDPDRVRGEVGRPAREETTATSTREGPAGQSDIEGLRVTVQHAQGLSP